MAATKAARRFSPVRARLALIGLFIIVSWVAMGYRLVQVDPVHAVHRAERGDPVIDAFESEAWGDGRMIPSFPISAVICRADVTLPRLRFVARPGELAFTGTERIG